MRLWFGRFGVPYIPPRHYLVSRQSVSTSASHRSLHSIRGEANPLTASTTFPTPLRSHLSSRSPRYCYCQLCMSKRPRTAADETEVDLSAKRSCTVEALRTHGATTTLGEAPETHREAITGRPSKETLPTEISINLDTVDNNVENSNPKESLGMNTSAPNSDHKMDSGSMPKGPHIALTEQESRLRCLLLDVTEYLRKENPSLRADDGEPLTLRWAGGWVRDKLLGSASHDIDVAINCMTGEAFYQALGAYCERPEVAARYQMQESDLGSLHLIRLNPEKSKNLETATARVFGMDLDFVNLRREEYAQDSRNPVVMQFGGPKEDAFRRDATVNALFYHLHTQEVEDYTERGLDDLRSGVIRTPLEPEQTFMDDPLRVLRLVRFASRLQFQLDAETERWMSDAAVLQALHVKISRERVGIELEKMLRGQHPREALHLIDRLGLYHAIFTDPARDSFPKADTSRWHVAYDLLEDLAGHSLHHPTVHPLFRRLVWGGGNGGAGGNGSERVTLGEVENVRQASQVSEIPVTTKSTEGRIVEAKSEGQRAEVRAEAEADKDLMMFLAWALAAVCPMDAISTPPAHGTIKRKRMPEVTAAAREGFRATSKLCDIITASFNHKSDILMVMHALKADRSEGVHPPKRSRKGSVTGPMTGPTIRSEARVSNGESESKNVGDQDRKGNITDRDVLGLMVRKWEGNGQLWRLQVLYAMMLDVMHRFDRWPGNNSTSAVRPARPVRSVGTGPSGGLAPRFIPGLAVGSATPPVASETDRGLGFGQSLVFESDPSDSDSPSQQQGGESDTRAAFLLDWLRVVDHIDRLGIADVATWKRLVDGRQLAQLLECRPGPWMTGALDFCLAWQLRHPHVTTADEALAQGLLEAVRANAGVLRIPV